MNKDKNYHSVLFTGGLDSTYRLCQLALDEQAVVEPVYIVFPGNAVMYGQKNWAIEISAQNKVLDYILKNKNTKAKFLPIKRVDYYKIPTGGFNQHLGKAPVIDDSSWRRMLSKHKLGSQYLCICNYAKWDKGVELCQEKLPWWYFAENLIEVKKDGLGRNVIVTTESNGAETDNKTIWKKRLIKHIFSDVTFPILGVTRKEMKENLNRWGYEGIWDMIWFCESPIDGKPCGICNNCVTKIQDGLEAIFSKEAIKRYRIFELLLSEYGKNISDLYQIYTMENSGKTDVVRKNEFIKLLSKINSGSLLVNGEPVSQRTVEEIREILEGQY